MSAIIAIVLCNIYTIKSKCVIITLLKQKKIYKSCIILKKNINPCNRLHKDAAFFIFTKKIFLLKDLSLLKNLNF
jgi:hypothetical protein